MKTENSRPWYKTWWGILFIVIPFWPIILPYLIWAKSGWSNGGRIVATIGLVFFFVAIVSSPAEKPELKPNTTVVVSEEETYVFDLESLYGKNIDEVRIILDGPADTKFIDPTEKQMFYGSTWDNTFEKDGKSILATFNTETREITEFFIGVDDPTGAAQDTSEIEKLANLGNPPKYEIRPIKAINGSGLYTGVAFLPIR